MDERPTIEQAAVSLAADAKIDAEAGRNVAAILCLSGLTLMIDEKVITHEQAVQRIEQLQSEWLGEKDQPRTRELLRRVIAAVRQHERRAYPGWTPVVHQGRDDPD